jgi:hypothetical protein
VEELRGNVINRKTRVNMSDVENMALILSKSRSVSRSTYIWLRWKELELHAEFYFKSDKKLGQQ